MTTALNPSRSTVLGRTGNLRPPCPVCPWCRPPPPLPPDDACRRSRRCRLLTGAALLGVPAFLAAGLALINLHDPLGEHGSLGALASLGVAGLAATVGYLVVRRLVARPVWVPALALLAYAAALVVLFPHPVGVHESFVPQVNERQACHGWAFEHYPPGVRDRSATTYCVGVETVLPPG